MNHPKPEEWVPYLFGEAGSKQTQTLSRHLEGCEQCRDEVAGWQRNLARLDAWKVSTPGRMPVQGWFVPLMKWAAAAVVVLAMGFGAGRLSAGRVDPAQVRQAIEPQIREQLRQEFSGLLREQIEKVEAQRVADYVALKADLDTVAVLTETGLRRTERQLVQLANYTQPVP